MDYSRLPHIEPIREKNLPLINRGEQVVDSRFFSIDFVLQANIACAVLARLYQGKPLILTSCTPYPLLMCVNNQPIGWGEWQVQHDGRVQIIVTEIFTEQNRGGGDECAKNAPIPSDVMSCEYFKSHALLEYSSLFVAPVESWQLGTLKNDTVTLSTLGCLLETIQSRTPDPG